MLQLRQLKQVLAIICLTGVAAAAQDASSSSPKNTPNPAIIFDAGGKFDKSFNEAAYNGAEAFKQMTKLPYTEYELRHPAELTPTLRVMSKLNLGPIVTLGYSSIESIEKVAPEYPSTHFVIIDAEVQQPNVRSILFLEDEGSFLAGALAAMKSKTGKLAFIGGMDIPVVRRFGCGYENGAKYINPKIKVFKTYVGTTGDAWNNPAKGVRLANAQFKKGVDVIFAPAGGTANGVYQAAKDNGKYAIGVDANQNHLFPGAMLTSVVKRIDVAVLNTFLDAQSGQLKSGTISMGLAEDGVDLAFDENNRDLVSPAMRAKIAQIKAKIIAQKIDAQCSNFSS